MFPPLQILLFEIDIIFRFLFGQPAKNGKTNKVQKYTRYYLVLIYKIYNIYCCQISIVFDCTCQLLHEGDASNIFFKLSKYILAFLSWQKFSQYPGNFVIFWNIKCIKKFILGSWNTTQCIIKFSIDWSVLYM